MWRDDYRSVISPAVLTVPVRIVTVSLDKRILICAYLISSSAWQMKPRRESVKILGTDNADGPAMNLSQLDFHAFSSSG
jgi:hypothetical protein